MTHVSQESSHFEGFIYLWIVFNGWASQVVVDEGKSQNDKYLVAALGQDQELNRCFEELKENNASFQSVTTGFASLWPVFKVRTLIRLRIQPWGNKQPRYDYIRSVIHRPEGSPTARAYAPPCFREHENNKRQEGERRWYDPPNDWAHTLSAIYMVRCNLFHGGKDFQSSRDREFISKALKILWEVWEREIPSSIRLWERKGLNL